MYLLFTPSPATMGGECRMAGVAVATPTLPVPHQHFALLSLLATPTLTCWLIILCFGHTNFGNHTPPMPATTTTKDAGTGGGGAGGSAAPPT